MRNEKMKRRLFVRKNIVLNEKIIFGMILAALIAVYNFVWIDKNYVMCENWADFYNALIDKGQIPYKDFYYYLPPLNLFLDYIFAKMSFGYMMIYRLWRLLERILMFEIMYMLLLKRVHPYIACIGCFGSAAIYSANVYAITGDYNQTCQLLIALLCVFIFQYIDNIDNKKRKFFWLFLSGICGGLMFLCKQTVVWASACCFAILMIVFVIFKIEKTFFRSAITVLLGACLPLIVCVIYLGVHHAIAPFVYQVFIDVSSKGTLYSITVGKLLSVFRVRFYGILSIICAFAAYIASIKKEELKTRSILVFREVFIVLSALFFGYAYAGAIFGTWKVVVVTGMVLLMVLQLIAGLSVFPSSKFDKGIFFYILCITALVLFVNPRNVTVDFYIKTSLLTYMAEIVTLFFVFLLIWGIVHIIRGKIAKEKLDLYVLTLVFGGIASGYTAMMANGEANVPTLSAVLIIPTVVFIVFKDKDIHTFFPVKILQASLLLVFGGCMSQKLVNNYAWWGDSEASYWEKTETINIKKLAGFKFSKREKAKIEGLCNLIDYYTDGDSVIWGFPYVKIYNYLLDNYNMSGFVPVGFYDVCADDYAIQEAELLASNEPDIVVWMDIPNCIEAHEGMFRNGGRLGHRDIQKWFSEVKDTDYTLIGQVDNVFVYKLQDGTDISYTYIEHKTAVNTTAVYNEAAQMPECTLNGSGTIQSPFLITSLEDLETFRDLVNKGMSFSGQYIRQTADIDLQNYGEWEPIGIYESGKLFAGNYDGDGYAVKGLYINRPEENVGLFGQLAGTVENLSVIDCDVTGSCIGGIASHGVGADSKIINCMVTGRLYSYGRAGGIADNMGVGGSIINCVTDVELKGDGITSGVSGYYINTVVNCYSSQGSDGVLVDDGMKYTEDSIGSLNEYIEQWKNSDYGQLLNEWELVDGKVSLTHKY